jgi:RNA polymerase sigma-70 factor (ECF subfamily)
MLVLGGTMVAVGAKAEVGTGDSARRSLEEHEFNNMYARTARPLAAFIRRMTPDDDTARDLVQESYLRILRADLPTLDKRGMDAYLYKTASRLVRDRWRHSQVDRRWRESLPEETSEVDGSSADALDMDRVLQRLRPRDRAIIWLAYVEGRSHKEIAEILSLQAASVRVLLFRARKKLAGILEAEGLAPEVTP